MTWEVSEPMLHLSIIQLIPPFSTHHHAPETLMEIKTDALNIILTQHTDCNVLALVH